MEKLSRRDLCVALSTFAAMGRVTAQAQLLANPGGNPGDKVLSDSKTFPFDKLPVSHSKNGGESRHVVQGVQPTGEYVEMHETTLPPGQMPHPPHKHRHSEFMMIREGTVEFDNDGTKETVGPGGVIFAASDKTHGLKNVGSVPALYFVIAIGRESGVQRV